MLTEIPEAKYIRYICIFERSNEKIISRKLKYIFTKKLHHNYQDILGYKL